MIMCMREGWLYQEEPEVAAQGLFDQIAQVWLAAVLSLQPRLCQHLVVR